MQELISRRNRNSKTYDLGNGELNTIINVNDIHYKNNDIWEEINTNFEFEDGFGWKVKEAPHNLRITENYIRFGFNKGVYVDFYINTVNAIIEGSKLTLSDYLLNSDFIYDAKTNGLKGDIVLKQPNHPSSFSFNLFLNGCVAEVVGNELHYKIGEETIGMIPSPFMDDAEGNRGEVLLSYSNNTVTFTPDSSFLETAIYPIIIDPTVTIQPDSTSGHDTYIQNNAPDVIFGGTETQFNIGVSADNIIARGLLKFDVSSIPVGSLLTAGSFICHTGTNYNGTSYSFSLRRILANWDKSTVTWNNQPSTSTSGNQTISIGANNTTFTKTSMQAIFDYWVNGGSNYGLMVQAGNEATAGTRKAIHSSQNATESFRPSISMTYTEPTPLVAGTINNSSTIGSPILSVATSGQTVNVASISSTELIGITTLFPSYNLTASSIQSISNVGSINFSKTFILLPNSISPTSLVGGINFSTNYILNEVGISNTSYFGSVNYITNYILNANSINSTAVIGNVGFSTTKNVLLTGISSNSTIGTATITLESAVVYTENRVQDILIASSSVDNIIYNDNISQTTIISNSSIDIGTFNENLSVFIVTNTICSDNFQQIFNETNLEQTIIIENSGLSGFNYIEENINLDIIPSSIGLDFISLNEINRTITQNVITTISNILNIQENKLVTIRVTLTETDTYSGINEFHEIVNYDIYLSFKTDTVVYLETKKEFDVQI